MTGPPPHCTAQKESCNKASVSALMDSGVILLAQPLRCFYASPAIGGVLELMVQHVFGAGEVQLLEHPVIGIEAHAQGFCSSGI